MYNIFKNFNIDREVEKLTAGHLQIRFWGTRGSIPITGAQNMKYGGNTSCVEIKIGQTLIIIDAGTGIYHLGRHLTKGTVPVKACLLLSHVHLDHIQGFPLFEPAFNPNNLIHIYGEVKESLSLREQLAHLLQPPYWPIGLGAMKADMQFQEMTAGEMIQITEDIRVRTIRGNHPGGTILFRIEHGAQSVCYISDYEHSQETEPDLIGFVRDTDVLIYDATYTETEYEGQEGQLGKQGWGHSTFMEGCKLATLSGAKQLILYHHSPDRTDEQLDSIEQEARQYFEATSASYDGMEIHL